MIAKDRCGRSGIRSLPRCGSAEPFEGLAAPRPDRMPLDEAAAVGRQPATLDVVPEEADDRPGHASGRVGNSQGRRLAVHLHARPPRPAS